MDEKIEMPLWNVMVLYAYTNDKKYLKLIEKAFEELVPKESEVGSRKTQCPSDHYEMAGSPHSREKLSAG